MSLRFLQTDMKKYILALLLIVTFFANVFAGDPSEAVKKFVRESGITPETVAIKIIDLSDGAVTASHNPSTPLIPASIMKSVTTASLLEETGCDWRYHTRVYIDGPVDLGILKGNIIVEGSGDPSLNSPYEPFSEDIIEEIAVTLSHMLITHIDGKIIIDESLLEGASRPESWASGDFKKYYGTGSHAFNFMNNANGDFSVENPSNVFISQLKNRLLQDEVEVEGKDYNPGVKTQILDHLSAPIDDIMRSCMMRSDNLFAESFLRTYGKLKGENGSTSSGADLEYETWKKKNMPLEGVIIVDGSGLSRENRITADFMCAVLENMSGDVNYASFFPLAGQEGTLKKFLVDTPLDSYIAMKTGSMTGIQCYAGYKLDDDYIPTHAVVIIMNNIAKNRDRAKKAAERMLLDIFNGN